MAESFVGTLKTELIRGRMFATRFEAELAVVEYLGWFNHTRLHEALDDRPPAEFEALYAVRDETITETIINKETN
jgi:putative transposase